MNVEWILNKSRRLAYTNIWQYPNVEWLEDLNEIYQDLVTTITQEVNENYFYDIFKGDLVVWQNEYTFRTPTAGVVWMNKLKALYIKYDTDYKKARQISESTMEMTPEWYEINQSPENPLFRIADNSVFIYPTPTEAVVWGIKLSATTMPKDLLINDDESAIKLHRQYHNVLVWGILPYIFQSKGMINEKNDALATYERLKRDLVRKLTDRDLSPLVTSLPDLSYYE